MNIKELKETIASLPDDMLVEIDVVRQLTDEEISSTKGYCYPNITERCQINKGAMDIGWTDNKVKFNIEIKELANISEKSIWYKVDAMCSESLDPETSDKWDERVKYAEQQRRPFLKPRIPTECYFDKLPVYLKPKKKPPRLK